MNGGEVAERLFDDVFTGLEERRRALLPAPRSTSSSTSPAWASAIAPGTKGLPVCFPELGDPARGRRGRAITLRGLFNPLLLGEKRRARPVRSPPSHEPGSVVIVTGPNSGGKTRLLQAIAARAAPRRGRPLRPRARGAPAPRRAGSSSRCSKRRAPISPRASSAWSSMRIRRMFEQLDVGLAGPARRALLGHQPVRRRGDRPAGDLAPPRARRAGLRHARTCSSSRRASPTSGPFPRLEFLQVELGDARACRPTASSPASPAPRWRTRRRRASGSRATSCSR